MNHNEDYLYKSDIIRAAALVPDVKLTLSHWDSTINVDENLSRILEENLFGKASRNRLKQVLRLFRQRYLENPQVRKALRKYVHHSLHESALKLILFYHFARQDQLLYDIVVEFINRRWKEGYLEIDTEDFFRELQVWNEEGRMSTDWGETTLNRVARNLATSLRDFGLLEGEVNKRIVNFPLPISVFAHVAFFLRQEDGAGSSILNHPDWQLFSLPIAEVENYFLKAHQLDLLEYYASGSTVRLEFPKDTLEEYADVILQRAA